MIRSFTVKELGHILFVTCFLCPGMFYSIGVAFCRGRLWRKNLLGIKDKDIEMEEMKCQKKFYLWSLLFS